MAFAVAAAVIVGLAFAAATTVAVAHEAVTDRIRAGAPVVKRWGGWMLIGLGVWFIVLSAFAEFFARVFPV